MYACRDISISVVTVHAFHLSKNKTYLLLLGVELTVAAVEVCVGAGSAVLWPQVDLGIEVLRHGGVSLLTGGLLRI